MANDLVVGYLPNSVISRGRSLNSVLGRRSHSRAFNKMAIMKVPSFERAPTVAVYSAAQTDGLTGGSPPRAASFFAVRYTIDLARISRASHRAILLG